MARKRPTLQEVQRLYPSDLARCVGYTWHLGTRIGKGSFGEVYLGWTLVSLSAGEERGRRVFVFTRRRTGNRRWR